MFRPLLKLLSTRAVAGVIIGNGVYAVSGAKAVRCDSALIDNTRTTTGAGNMLDNNAGATGVTATAATPIGAGVGAAGGMRSVPFATTTYTTTITTRTTTSAAVINQSTAATATAAAVGTDAAASYQSSAVSDQSTVPSIEPEWAYPHPYDLTTEKSRFLDSSSSKYREENHVNLFELVKLWEDTEGEETWPWVWCLRNPVGPHHVFIGVSKDSLEIARKVALDDRNNNLTIICDCVEDIEKYARVEEFYECRCGVVFSPVQQSDMRNKILMLRDERILCYDYAYCS